MYIEFKQEKKEILIELKQVSPRMVAYGIRIRYMEREREMDIYIYRWGPH
jgi:hypothetical protein